MKCLSYKSDLEPVKDKLTACMHVMFSVFFYRWFPEVQNIYYQGNKRKLVPSNQNSQRLEAFFSAASVLMTNQLQSLALLSIEDYTKLFCPPEVSELKYISYMHIVRIYSG